MLTDALNTVDGPARLVVDLGSFFSFFPPTQVVYVACKLLSGPGHCSHS
jgi:hypothetical protein